MGMRKINKFIAKRPMCTMKLETASEFLKQLRPGYCLWSVDLQNAYFHVSFHWRSVPFMCFRWRGRDFASLVLPFGLASSAWATITVSSVAVRVIGGRGLVGALCHYIDGILDASATRDRVNCLETVKLLIDMDFLLSRTSDDSPFSRSLKASCSRATRRRAADVRSP